jgi:hypothetical protein
VQRGLLTAGFAIAALPFSGLVGTGVRYAARSHRPGALPSWYGLVFAGCSLVVTGLFAVAALAALGHGPGWSRLFRATLVALPLVAVASLASPPLIGGMAVLTFAVWVLKKRTSRDSA